MGSPTASRFGYLGGYDPDEGGVRKAGKRPATGAAPSGVPGPAERLLDISELARTVGMHYTHAFHIPPYPTDDLAFSAPLVGEITLSNTGGVLLLRGNVHTDLQLECARCVESFVTSIEADLEEEFDLVTTRNAHHQEEVQAVDEDTPASVITGNILDLGELLRQNLLLAAPLQPLCREECPGVDLGGRSDVTVGAPVATQESGVDSPLRHLADLLAAREMNPQNEETQER